MLGILLLAGTLAAAQPQGPQPQRPAQPLAGPTIATRPVRPTLVAFDLNGRLRRTEVAPELGALSLIHVTKEARARVDAVIGARAAAIDRFVSENLLLLSQLDTASKAGARLDQFLLLVEGFDKLRPVLKDGPLRDRIVAALPPRDRASFAAIFDEYWNAAVAEGLSDNRAQGKHDARWQIDLGERFNQLGQEIVRSYERQAAMGTLFFDYLLHDLDLTDQQRQTIETLKLDMLARTNLRPTEEDQKRLGLGILAYLNERQRLEVIRRVGGR